MVVLHVAVSQIFDWAAQAATAAVSAELQGADPVVVLHVSVWQASELAAQAATAGVSLNSQTFVP